MFGRKQAEIDRLTEEVEDLKAELVIARSSCDWWVARANQFEWEYREEEK